MPYPRLLHPGPLSLRQSTADPYLTGDTQTQFCLSLCGISGSWCAQGLFEPSECLWRAWALILNANSPLPQSCWGFSFALGHGISPHSCSSTYCLNGISLALDVGYLLRTHPGKQQPSSATAPDLGRGYLLSVAGSRASLEVISIPCKLIYSWRRMGQQT